MIQHSFPTRRSSDLIGDPGPNALFAGQVYDRGALTLHALRREVGDRRFFQILEQWVITQGGGTVTTRELIDLAESIYNKDLDPLFAEWLSAGKPASIVDENPGPNRSMGRALGHLSSALKQGLLGKAAATEALAATRSACRRSDRKSTRLNSSHWITSRMPSSA